MGEHYVAVAYDKLKRIDEPANSTTASNTTSIATRPTTNVDGTARTAADGTARTTGAATTTADHRKAEGHWYPDHVVYNATTGVLPMPSGDNRLPDQAASLTCSTSRPSLTSSVITLKRVKRAAPNAVEMATSAASRPRAMTMRPMRG
jgi:hypothetical protein